MYLYYMIDQRCPGVYLSQTYTGQEKESIIYRVNDKLTSIVFVSTPEASKN